MDGISIVEGNEWILHGLGILYADQDRLSDAEAMNERALQGYEKALGPEHTSTLNTVNNLANLYTRLRRISEARMYVRCQGGVKAVLGAKHERNREVTRQLAPLDNLEDA